MIQELLFHLKRGKLTFIGKPIFSALVMLELFYEHLLDSFVQRPYRSSLVDAHVTAIIKTFERPKELRRLIKSIRHFYPDMKIVVVDDSRNPSDIEGVETIVMPYDSGVSAGRNLAVSAVETEYLLLLDDDYVFYRQTDLEPAVIKMGKNPEIDIMGGKRIDLPLYASVDYYHAALYPSAKRSLLPLGTKVDGMTVLDKVANFYIGRTERIKQVGWDECIKRLDHSDFFTRAKGTLLTVFNPDLKILHAQAPFNKTYMQKRNAFEEDSKRIFQKYYSDRKKRA